MASCRTVITSALRALRAIGPGDDPEAGELLIGLPAIQDLMLELHEARGPLRDVDVSADWTASEGQRVRVQAGANVTVTLPNSVLFPVGWRPYDYGFTIAPAFDIPEGSTGSADGITTRAPRDGARIEIVGTTQQIFFYRADRNAWFPVYGLTLDGEVPLSERYNGPLAALLAERVVGALTETPIPPELAVRIRMARPTLFVRPGVARDAVRSQYF